jgi:hypothetical protein
MRNFFILFFSVLSFAAGAQTASSAAFDLTYINHFNSVYQVKITNKQGCDAFVQVNWNGKAKDSTIVLGAGASITAALPGPYISGSSIKIKSINTCVSGANSGWLAIKVPSHTVLDLQDPVVYQRPVLVSNEIISLYDLIGNWVRTLREKDLPYTLQLLPKGVYLVRSSTRIKKVYNY